ncbi:dihydrolipoyl dehydrogenase [Gracilibacillus marinus]|uniref:Dihydrolipoyl dehydrogenase n=1 Tax=Gracilibacillus marinus TaxID=630535 RepID=A0ABV8W007_9BACI
MAKEYDVVVLGGGTGGYVAAIRAAQSGLKTAIVEKEKLGGTCLHKGCIPTKALLKSAAVFQTVRNASKYGVEVNEPTFQLSTAITRKEKIVNQLHQGVKNLVSKQKIDVYNGHGRILGPSIFSPMAGSISVEYDTEMENDILVPKNVILATGSKPKALPTMEVDGDKIIHSDQALCLTELPSSIAIIGGGVIGVEWASFFQTVGVDVTIVEAGDRILPTADKDISKQMHKHLQSMGVQIRTNTLIKQHDVDASNKIELTINNQDTFINVDKVLVAVGREANISNIGIENTDIELLNNFIKVNEYGQTKESHIYAIGDVIGGLQLAHVATYEAQKAIEHILGKAPTLFDQSDIPVCIYGEIEVASLGLTEEEAISKGYAIQTTKTSLQAIGKAHVNGSTKGFAKIIIDESNDDIIGVHLIGQGVTELIGQVSVANYFDSSGLELSEIIAPHPSISEIIMEVALAAKGRKIHG